MEPAPRVSPQPIVAGIASRCRLMRFAHLLTRACECLFDLVPGALEAVLQLRSHGVTRSLQVEQNLLGLSERLAQNARDLAQIASRVLYGTFGFHLESREVEAPFAKCVGQGLLFVDVGHVCLLCSRCTGRQRSRSTRAH